MQKPKAVKLGDSGCGAMRDLEIMWIKVVNLRANFQGHNQVVWRTSESNIVVGYLFD